MTTRIIEDHALSAASMANNRNLKVIRYGNRTSGRKVYIQAGLHADEAPGFLVMHHLIEWLDTADQNDAITGEIVLVPVANPIGADQWRDEQLQGRFDFFNGVNFKRPHFPVWNT